MRSNKAQILSRVHAIPTIRFCDQTLTSASGLVLFQLLFDRLDLKKKLRHAFHHLNSRGDFKFSELFLVLVVHILLGYRKLSDIEYYKDDPIVARVVGLRRLPDDSTLSRRLRSADMQAVAEQQTMNRSLVLGRLAAENLGRITMDFDGSACSTRRYAEGTAVGFNRKRKVSEAITHCFARLPKPVKFSMPFLVLAMFMTQMVRWSLSAPVLLRRNVSCRVS